MRKITLNEMVKELENQLVNITLECEYTTGIDLEMTKARMQFLESENELCFTAGNSSTDGLGAFTFRNISETIESIEEENGSYTIEFNCDISDLVISRA